MNPGSLLAQNHPLVSYILSAFFPWPFSQFRKRGVKQGRREKRKSGEQNNRGQAEEGEGGREEKREPAVT